MNNAFSLPITMDAATGFQNPVTGKRMLEFQESVTGSSIHRMQFTRLIVNHILQDWSSDVSEKVSHFWHHSGLLRTA